MSQEELRLFKDLCKTVKPKDGPPIVKGVPVTPPRLVDSHGVLITPTAFKEEKKEQAEEKKKEETKLRKPHYLANSNHTTMFETIESVIPTRTGFMIDSPVRLLLMLMPELTPYRWQFEELEKVAGRFPGQGQVEITSALPYKLCLAAANGSGKDLVMIAGAAVWFAMVGIKNRVVITSSSHDQIKLQTEPHIINLITRANQKFGNIFKSIQFHHVIPELGSEIKLFATDEPQKAEGYHPFLGGKMMMIMNEAKGIPEEIFAALSRCHGYSHWLEISSPGRRSGTMFRDFTDGVEHPKPIQLGKFASRRVTAFDCPHISPAEILSFGNRIGTTSPLYRSSILAEFSDYDESVVVPLHIYEEAEKAIIAQNGSDIGIGLDLSAGGDECGFWVRKGNTPIDKYFFHQSDTGVAVDLIHNRLLTYFDLPYVFNADDGGLGKVMIDMLVAKGWRINRRNNQSPAHNKREFLNLGAELYFRVRRLLERKRITPLLNGQSDEKLKEQLTTRRFKGEASTQGKFSLESKKEAKAGGRPSPDRADAFVLCFYNYQVDDKPTQISQRMTPEEYRDYIEMQSFMQNKKSEPTNNFFTYLNGKY